MSEPKTGAALPEEDNAETEGAEGSAGTSIEKFKTGKERDKAYLELEKHSSRQNQKMADLEAKVDQLASIAASKQADEQPEKFSDTYKSQEELKRFWERFATKPQEVFEEVVEKAVGRSRVESLAREAIQDFKRDNPDLARHEDLVSSFVARTDPKKAPRERLRLAAPEVRKYIAELAKGGSRSEEKLDADTFVEGPSGSRDSGQRSTVSEPSEEDELALALKEHSALMAKKMIPPRLK